jgi:class 3 adenylate cyclase
MVAFSSVSDALQAAVALQQAARWPVDGLQLAVRVGLDVGETLRADRDHFGTTVLVARRLCDRAEGGQILTSALFADLLGGRRTFRFEPRGRFSIDGIAASVDACEVLYDDRPGRGASSGASRRRAPTVSFGVEELDAASRASSEPPPHPSAPDQGETGVPDLSAGIRRFARWIRSRSV